MKRTIVFAGAGFLLAAFLLSARGRPALGSGGSIEGANHSDGVFTCAAGRTFYVWDVSLTPPTTVGGPIPGASAIVETAALGQGSTDYVAFLENGDAYVTTGGAGWVLIGNVLGKVTPTREQSWGEVKARYR